MISREFEARLKRTMGQDVDLPVQIELNWDPEIDPRPPMPERVPHALQHLQFHALDVDLDAVNRIVAAVHEWPQPIKPCESRINVCVSGTCTRGVGHSPRQRQTAHFKRVRRSESHRQDRELIESIQQPALIDASRGHRDRLEREDTAAGPDEARQRECGVTVMRANVDPGVPGPHFLREPVEQRAFRTPENAGRIVVP